MSAALLRLEVTVNTPGAAPEKHNIDITSRDILIWEKTGRDRSYAHLMQQQDMAPIYVIAHLAMRRLELFTGDLDSFEARCDIRAIGDDEGDEGSDAGTPTRPARSRTRPSRSR